QNRSQRRSRRHRAGRRHAPHLLRHAPDHQQRPVVRQPQRPVGSRLMSTSARNPQSAHGPSPGASIIKWSCILLTVAFVGLFLLLPLVTIFYETLRPVEVRPKPAGSVLSILDEIDGKKEAAPPPSSLGLYWTALTKS